MKKIFLCYRHEDAPDMAGWVFDRLSGHFGVENVFKDVHKIKPGEDFREALANAVQQCDAIVLIIGKSWLNAVDEHGNRRLDDPNDYVRIEIRSALDRGVRLVPVLVHGAEVPKPDELPEPIRELAFRMAAIVRGDPDFKHDMDRLCRSLEGDDEEVTGTGGEEEPEEPRTCPYRGLGTFRSEHAEFFFGRESLVERMLGKLRTAIESDAQSRFLAIVGASGSGKSSLAQAGLIPALTAGKIQGSSEWPVVVCRPGRNPLESLAVALAAHSAISSAIADVGDLIDRSQDDRRRLHLTTRLALQGRDENQHVVVLVDQFEELFTLCSQDDLRKAFLDNLLFAASSADGNTIVVITMRADFYGKASAFPDLASALSDHQVLVGPMTEDELRLAIERPAELVGTEVEAGLAEMLIQDTRRQPGSLPFLQDALRQLWECHGGRRLTVEDYNAIGRLEGAIESRANEVFEKLSEPEQTFCRQIFLRLVQPGEGTEDTKRSASWKEIADSEAMTRTLQALVNARLLTAKRDGDDLEGAFIEVSHEALIRGWSRLHQWVEEDREWLKIQHQLTEAANEWNDHNCDPAFLYRGARLEIAEEWADTRQENLNRGELDFLGASIRLRESEEQEKLLAAARLRRRAWTAATAAVVAVSLAVLAFLQAHRAREARAEAQREAQISDAQRLAILAREQLDENVLQSIETATESMAAAMVDGAAPEERKPCEDALREALDIEERREKTLVLRSTEQRLLEPVISPDRRWLVAQSYDRSVFLWQIGSDTDPCPRVQLRGPKGSITSVNFSPNSCWLLVRGEENRLRLWDLMSEEPAKGMIELGGHYDRLTFASFEPRNRWLITSDGSDVRIWDLLNVNTSPIILPVWGGRLLVAVSPNGDWLITQNSAGATLWRLTDERPSEVGIQVGQRIVFEDSGELSTLVDVSWSGSTVYYEDMKYPSQSSQCGQWLPIVQERQRQLHLLDLNTDNPDTNPIKLPYGGHDIRFSHNGSRLVMADFRETVVWDLKDKELLATDRDACQRKLPESLSRYNYYRMRLSPDGRWLVMTDYNEFIGLDLDAVFASQKSPEELKPQFRLQGFLSSSVEFSEDGRWFAAMSNSSSAAVIDLNSPSHEQRTIPCHLSRGMTRPIMFSADSRWLATPAVENSTFLWDLRKEQPFDSTLALNGESPIRAIAFGRGEDQQVIATVHDWEVRAWQMTSEGTRQRPKTLSAATVRPRTTAISTDSEWFVRTLRDTAILAHSPPGEESVELHEFKASGRITHTLISPDTRWLITGSDDGIVNCWDLSLPASQTSPTKSFTHSAPITTMAFSPDGRWLVTASADNKAFVWDFEGEHLGEDPRKLEKHTAGIHSVAIDPDSRWVVTMDLHQKAYLWKLSDPKWEPVEWNLARRDITGSKDNLVTSDDWTTRIWNTRLGALVLNAPSQTERSAVADNLVEKLLQNQVNATLVAENASRASWAPSGEEIVFVSDDGGLKTLRLGESKPVRLTAFGSSPAWQPKTGAYIAFEWGSGKNTELWAVEPSSGQCRHLARGGWPVWSGDGRTLFFHSREKSQVMSISFDPNPGQPVVAFEEQMTWACPMVSPDGRRLAYCDQARLLVKELSTGKVLCTVPVNGMSNVLGAWSNDSKQIAFGGKGTGGDNAGLWVVDVDAQTSQLVAYGDSVCPAWSSDGHLIFHYCGSPTNQLWKVDAEQIRTLDSTGLLTESDLVDYYKELLQETGLTQQVVNSCINLATSLAKTDSAEKALEALSLAGKAPDSLEIGGPTWQQLIRAALTLSRVFEADDKRDTALKALALAADYVPDPSSADSDESKISAGDVYNIACLYARLGDLAAVDTEKEAHYDKALDWFSRSIKRGYTNVSNMVRDTDMVGIRQRQEFLEAITPLLAEAGNPDDYVVLGQFDDAARELKRLREMPDSTVWKWWYVSAPLFIKNGDLDGYEAYRVELLERFGDTTAHGDASKIVKACLLRPPTEEVLKKLFGLCDLALNLGATTNALPWYQLDHGLALYRSGDYDKAVEPLKESSTSEEPRCQCQAFLVLSMVFQKLGKEEDAKLMFQNAVEIMESDIAQPSNRNFAGQWHDWFICDIFREEAESELGLRTAAEEPQAVKTVVTSPDDLQPAP